VETPVAQWFECCPIMGSNPTLCIKMLYFERFCPNKKDMSPK